MAGVNKVILIGNLGADPEIRNLPSGTSVANFNIATSESYTKDGQKITQTEWHRIELWDGLARIAEQYLRKGSQVYIEGKLRTDSWTDKEGQNRSTIKIRGINMTLLGKPSDASSYGSDSSGQSTSSPASRPASNYQQAPSQSEYSESGVSNDAQQEDDLPF
ncbi:MAG: single-stranded DNA-binding protein [Cyclobacteriaceae bacterium]